MMRSLAAAWRFLSIIPCPWWVTDDEAEALARSPSGFPVIGLILGVCSCAIVALLSLAFPIGVTAALAVAALAAFSGGLHLDGFADSADALLSPGHTREKALEVMKDSRVGAHGAMALILLLLLKYACLASLEAGYMPWVVLAAPVAGRAAMLLPMAYLPYAREKGLGRIFSMANPARAAAIACLWTAALLVPALGIRGAVVGFLLWLAMAFGWIWFLRRRLGGATGDTYGAICEMGEAVVCLASAIAW